MDKRTAKDLARGHVARCLRTHLDAGWPDAEDFGYTDAEQALVAGEIERITRGYEERSNRAGLL